MKAKNRSVSRSAAAVLTLALAAAGCGAKPGNTIHPADSPAESVASTGKSVGIAFPSDETERWKTEGEWLAKRFTSRGYEAKLIYSGGQADRQAKDLASLISGGVSLLIVAPVDAEKLSDPLAAAREAGIPVLSYGSVIRNSDAVTCAVLPDSRQMGVLQAQSVISALGVSKDENAKVSRIELAAGPAEDPQTALLYDGIYSTLEPYLSAGSLKVPSGEVRLADVSADSQEEAESRMEQILKSQNIKEMMEQNGCCTCERCQADVLALTLPRLPSKYVVLYGEDTSPRISFFEAKYRMDILVEIMRAIEDVKACPHHGEQKQY